jgi:hypothetical protein
MIIAPTPSAPQTPIAARSSNNRGSKAHEVVFLLLRGSGFPAAIIVSGSRPLSQQVIAEPKAGYFW